MAVRRVEIRLTSSGFDEVFAKFDKLVAKIDEIKAKLDELDAKVVAPKVRLDGLDQVRADINDLKAKLTDLGAKTASPKVSLDGIEKLRAEVADLKAKLDSLGRETASPQVDVEGYLRAYAELMALKAELDDLNGKRAIAYVEARALPGGLFGSGLGGFDRSIEAGAEEEGRAIEGRVLTDVESGAEEFHVPWLWGQGLFMRSLRGIGGAVATGAKYLGYGSLVLGTLPIAIARDIRGALGAVSSFVQSVQAKLKPVFTAFGNVPWAGVGIGAGVALGVPLIPSFIPFVLGSLTGLGGFYGAYKYGSSLHAQKITLEQELKKSSSTLKAYQKEAIQDQIRALKLNPFVRFYRTGVSALDLKGLEGEALRLVTEQGHRIIRTPGLGRGAVSAKTPSIIDQMTSIVAQLGKELKPLVPVLVQMFQAALPYVKPVVQILANFAKTVLPALTQSFREMRPYIPMIVAGFSAIAQGIAMFIRNLGPGMKGSATAFKGTAIVIEYVLGALGWAIGNWAKEWANFFHEINVGIKWVKAHLIQDARDFRNWGHDVADAFSSANRWLHNFQHSIGVNFDKVRHDVSSTSDQVRHWIATTWDDIRHNTASTWDYVRHWIATQADGIWHDITSVFDRIRHDVAAAWDATWNDVQHAAQRIWNDIVSFFRRLPGVLYSIGRNIILGLVRGIESVAGSVESAISHIASLIPSKISSLLGIGSPSRVLRRMGLDAGRGLALGLEDSLSLIQAAAHKMGLMAIPAAARSHGPMMAGAGAGNIYVTVHADGLVDPVTMANKIWIALRDLRRVRGGASLGL